MAVNLDVLLQGPIFDFWAVPVTFTPLASQPGQPAYQGRGILNTYSASMSQASTARSIPTSAPSSTSARASSPCCPQQNDHVTIPLDCNNVPKGEYQIVDASSDGGGSDHADDPQIRNVRVMGITDTQSYSLVIRDGLFDAVSSDPFFANYTCRKTKMLRVQHELLPYLGVYIIDETMLPDGDANAGHIRFSHTLRIGFSAMVANNDQVLAEADGRCRVLADHESAVAGSDTS